VLNVTNAAVPKLACWYRYYWYRYYCGKYIEFILLTLIYGKITKRS